MPGQQRSTNCYGRIGHIKGRPMVTSHIKIGKINHTTIPDPVDKVSKRPAKYQGAAPKKGIGLLGKGLV